MLHTNIRRSIIMKKRLIMFTVMLMVFSGVVFKSSAYAGPEADEIYNYANALYENECFSSAIEQFSNLISNYSGSKHVIEAEYLVGECLQRDKKYWLAINHWKNLMKKYPNTETARDCESGVKMIKRIIENGTLVDAATNLADFEPYPVTIDDMLVKTYMDNISDHLGRLYINEKVIGPELDKSLFWCSKILADFPGSPMVVNGQDKVGYTYWLKNSPSDYKKSIEEYLKIVDMFPADDRWVLGDMKWCGDIARNQIGDTKYAADLYIRLIAEAKKRIGDISYYESYAKTQLSIMGRKIE